MTFVTSVKSLAALLFSVLLLSFTVMPGAVPAAVGAEATPTTTDWVLPNSVRTAYNYDQPDNVLRRDGAVARTEQCCGLLTVHNFTPVDIPLNAHIDKVEIRFHLAGVRTTYRFQQFDPSFADCVDHENPGYYKGFTPNSEDVLDDYIVDYTAQDCTIRPELARSGDYYVELIRYWSGSVRYTIDDIAVRFTYTPTTTPSVDSDDDGLLDDWETNGLTFDPDGSGPAASQRVDLAAMGADKNKPDIFVQLDWFANSEHSHQLSPTAIRTVVDAFAAAPFVSKTGSVGINLHVDQGPSSIMDHTTNRTWGALSRANQLPHIDRLGTGSADNYDWQAFQELKSAHFTPTGRAPVFRYAVVAHYYGSTGSSGISRGIGASDFIVSLAGFTGGVGSATEQAGTFMHELGHNLGLRHGGSDDIHLKPNYLSVMNYAFQTDGLIKNGVAGTLDYSRRTGPTLDENHLDERSGINTPGHGTIYRCSGSDTFATVRDASGPLDWNCDGDTNDTDVRSNVNGDDIMGRLTGYDDWRDLWFKSGAIGLAGATPSLPMVTAEEKLTPAVAASLPKIGLDYRFSGFAAPVDNLPTVNVTKAGSAIPVKFGLGEDRGLDIFAAGSPQSSRIDCVSGQPLDDIETTANPGNSGLSYDPASGRYTYVWKTDRTWSGMCRMLTVALKDGTRHHAAFKLK